MIIAFSVCVLNIATHSACDSRAECEATAHRDWVCVHDLNNNEGHCYKAIPNYSAARQCEKKGNRWQWHYDGGYCHRPGVVHQPSAVPAPQTPAGVSGPSSPEVQTPATVFEGTVNNILSEDATEPDGDSGEDTDSRENTLGIDPLSPDAITSAENQEAEIVPTVAETEVTTDTDATAPEVPDTSILIPTPTTRQIYIEVPDTSISIPTTGQIYISEIMFARGVHGTLPQWIEISNGSRTEQVNLSGWTITVQNTTTDTDVSVGAKAMFTIPEGTRIDPSGQHDTPSTVLIVTDSGRNNLDGAMADSQLVNLWADQQVELILFGISNRRYSLLSDIAFKVTLAPPATDVFSEEAVVMKRKAAIDVVGNLGPDGAAAWVLPTSEGSARSSIIRRHVSAKPKDGTLMESWMLASDTGLAEPMDLSVSSYYGLSTDIGTPGFRAGGALPVELSHFRPARQKDTGQIVITWSTQSELNNAGFFIKRSQQKDGEFKVVNPTMVPGAGTTSEKQFYTYTDTTAQPNVVYYYQIEDVSFDGQRQTLTRGIRLRGHVGAAGKVTTLWGALKVSRE